MPMYIHTIRLLKPSTNKEREKFNLLYTNPSDITNISDKLKYYRYQKLLHQKDLSVMMNVEIIKVKRWEQDKVRMIKGTWEKLLKLNAQTSANL